jgi:uncharacterized protein YcbK (DUF882 family)
VENSLTLSRRVVLGWGCALALGAVRHASAREERSLAFRSLHTGESLRAVYQIDGALEPDGTAQVDRLLRDHRTGEVHRIEPRLLDLLWALGQSLEIGEPYLVISGYRSPRTNAMLAAAPGSGVADGSLHLQGAAIDIRLERVPLERLHRAAVAQRGGGVGLYRRSNFIQIDIGGIRYW